MSSWFLIFNSDDDPSSESSSPRTPSASVKENVSSIFRGVAAFLPQPPLNSDVIAGMKNDLAEIKDAVKSRLSLFSSKLTSNLLQFPRKTNDGDDDLVEEEEDVVGVSEDVVDFVGKISSNPELWTDFPISLPDDFDMSDYQREHASEIERLVPGLMILRQKISHQISHGKFWMIYFTLLSPRLNEEDLKFLATPKVVEMRETVLQMLQNKITSPWETFENSQTDSSKEDGGQEVEESMIEHDLSDETLNAMRETKVVTDMDSDHRSPKESKNEEFSFSDMEDDDNDLSRSGLSRIKKVLSTTDAKEWVEVNENSESQIINKGSESEESDDWLNIKDSDIGN